MNVEDIPELLVFGAIAAVGLLLVLALTAVVGSAVVLAAFGVLKAMWGF